MKIRPNHRPSKTMKPMPSKTAASIKEIADLFSVSDRTIRRWRAEGKPVPARNSDGSENLGEWAKWFANHQSAGFSNAKMRSDREALFCEKVRIEIELKELQLATAQGRMLSRADVGERDSRLGSAVSAALRVLERELPTLILGLPMERAQAITRDETRRIQKLLADETSAFWKLHPESD